MALSMDEQRILDEIERGLASADPALATRMSSFGVPRRLPTLRMRRLRLVADEVGVREESRLQAPGQSQGL